MSAEVLREAARLMRERADLALVIQKGAWTVHESGYTVMDGVGLDVGTMATLSEAEHIASWHPAVALAVADWLDETAAGIMHRPQTWDAALALARTYIGDQP